MSDHVRIRCPICGMLGWQSRLAKDFKFEVMIQHITSRGRGGIANTYSEPETEDGVFMLKIALAEKMEVVAAELRDEARADVRELWQAEIKGGDWERASAITRAGYGATFDSVESAVVGRETVGFGCVSLPIRRAVKYVTQKELEVYGAENEEADETDGFQTVVRKAPLSVGLGEYVPGSYETVAGSTRMEFGSVADQEEQTELTATTKGRSETDEKKKARATIRYE